MSQITALVSGLWGDAGQNFANEQGGSRAVFGTKPLVADYKPINLGAEIGKGVGFNLENLDAIKQLLNNILPGFSDVLGAQQQNLSQIFSNAASELRGELPPDVIDQVQRSSAYQALQGGYGGTGMANANTARNLGLTSLDLTNQGAQLSALGGNAAQTWANLAEQAFSPFVVSTGQTAGTTAANNAGLQAQQQFQYNVNAAPDPGALGVFNLDAALGQQMLSFGMGAAGAALGGGGGSSFQAQPTNSYYQAPVGNSLGGNYAAASPGALNYLQNPTWGGFG